MADGPEKLNWKQACKVLGCSRSHLYNLINCGDLPAERSGRVRGLTVRRADCERYLRDWQDRVNR